MGAQPQNSRYFANHAGVRAFLDRCIDGIDFEKPKDDITAQIANIITLTKRDIKHQLDTIKRKGNSSSGRIDKELSFTLPDKTVRAELAKGNLVKRCGALHNFVYFDSEAGTGRNAGRHMEESCEKNRKGIEMLAERIAEITRGYTPGDIENVINEAFIRYMQEKHPESGEKKLPGLNAPEFGEKRLHGLNAPVSGEKWLTVRNAPVSGEKGLPDRNPPEFGNVELDCLYGHIYEAVERKNIRPTG